MPIYEYACGACGHQFELTQRITEDAISECPECGKPEAKRLISATAFHLKGSGWYKTDYGSSGGSNGTSGPPKKESSDKSAAKTDSTSEKKAAGDKASKEKSSTAKTSGSDSKPSSAGKKKQAGKKN